ncbi:hypothetical protein KL905_002923 [Ogataea polymorpha]|uniref:uncharacterized protein n=1 Tax=Ogataea polymorpha TaxID=460523 RepID=UPI0007F3C601|nr:uncharacterized protein OGAPODRAFT_15406 [Ogataea polymorpha]KAG7893344.1 hypothetical protein KL908_003077 [Ogataea polymorpha]KAG7921465.1 hypothetical protein KL905_002923 [Ogataea polymorpha]KAG7933973.1 hypothetical protein KL934_002895 [Ogataea polymorpha]OBA18780.1 hypothetical protein OGAPODRAFT_15406 [Ogataea polymorpha]
MTSTLKRTLTDIMEDELYSLPQQGQDDISEYIMLNGSQESFRQGEDENIAHSVQDQVSGFGLPPHQQSVYDNIYNSYANPNLYANVTFPDELYDYAQLDNYRYSNDEHENIDPKAAMNTPHQDVKPSEPEQEVMLIPQDDYIVYDPAHTEQQFLPEILQWEFNHKSFPQSNELNIFKTDDVYLDEEFSDDDEDEEDQNKLDDMEMDLDDLSSESSLDEENDNYVMKSDEFRVSNTPENTDSSIYSLTTPQTINPRLVQQDDIMDNNAAVFDDDDEMDDDEKNYSDASDDLYTPAFEQRRESVLSERRPPVLKSEVQKVPAPSLRKLKSSRRTVTPPTEEAKEAEEEEHVCYIANPKTGKPCNKKFSRPYDLVRHQNTIHAPKRSFYRCMFCEDDLRRRNNMESNNEIVLKLNYRNTPFSVENSNTNVANSHNSKKLKSSMDNGEFLSNKTFSRCDALTRHLRFRHGLNNQQVNDAMDYAKKHVEYYEN